MKNARGTYDIYKTNLKFREDVLSSIFTLAQAYRFEKIETPIFEHTELFKRAVGEETDVVSKEMYTFEDKKGRSLTLRPELTAPVVRSFIQNKLYASKNNERFYYYGPAFRYERPQAGRFRQFYQFGVESFNLNTPIHDAEVITLAFAILKQFNLDQNITLKINTLGQKKERENYIKNLYDHLLSHKDELCDDCLVRMEKNTLRVLDCKVCQQTNALKLAPKLIDFVGRESRERFDQVLSLLELQNISYEIDDKLVRGLDYYNDTVFEFVYKNIENKELALIGGGRYDGLVSEIGGPDTDAFGFGVGVERLLSAIVEKNPTILENYDEEIDVYYMPLTPEAIQISFKSLNKLRYYGYKCEMNYEIKSMKNNFKKAQKSNAIYAVIIGEDEIANNLVTIKNLLTKEEAKVKLSDFEDDLIMEANDEAHAH